jgi:pyridoxamine 5'-phosphate oxidase
MSIADLRREYRLGELRREDLAADPIAEFKRWFDQARGARASGRVRQFFIRLYKSLLLITGAEPMDINAMVLATADKQGRPSARVVLLKALEPRGLVFYTNFESRKGLELAENPCGALVFYWAGQERQVTVAGEVRKLPEAESDAYFRSRPRGAQLAAWASHQGGVVAGRETLDASWKEHAARYSGREVPRPPYWGGYVLAPTRIEFWQGRPNRLHDRFRYTRQPDGSWQIERLAP